MIESSVPLSINEALMYLNQRLQSAGEATNPVIKETLAYCQKFANASNPSVVKNIQKLYADFQTHLSMLEFKQLMDLAPNNVEEAQTLIPSLLNVEAQVVEEVLKELEIFRMYCS